MSVLNKFSKVRVLVAGDLMLDRYWWGAVDRISPEAPVPVVRLNRTSTVLGGAANVAANVAGLGATVSLVGVIGSDETGNEIRRLLERSAIDGNRVVLAKDGRPTSAKTRVVAHSQHVVRVDDETSVEIDPATEDEVLRDLAAMIDGCDVVLISDYAKGVLTERIVSEIIKISRISGKPVITDPKGRNYSKYRGASVLTPNIKEASEATGLQIDSSEALERAAYQLSNELEIATVIITQGKEGMTMFTRGESSYHVEARGRQVYDVTGAGDTVLATIGVSLGAGFDIRKAVELANTAAGIVVGEIGTTVVTLEKLLGEVGDDISTAVRPATGS